MNTHTNKGLSNAVSTKEKRKLSEKQKSKQGVWFGLGMFGLIGWSVVVPTILGTVLGIWLDKNFPGKQSWTLTFLIIGLMVGCAGAWHWISKENKEIHKNEDLKNE
jgi:ATP synthase protein I